MARGAGSFRSGSPELLRTRGNGKSARNRSDRLNLTYIEMEPLFINTTELNKETLWTFNKSHYSSYRMFLRPLYAVYLLIGIFFLILNVSGLLMGEEVRWTGIFLPLLLILLGFYPRLVLRWSFRRYLQTEKRLPIRSEYDFSEPGFRCVTPTSREEVEYSLLYRVVETEGYFYLYINKMNACIVDKNGFSRGTPEQFSVFIREKTGKLYSDRSKRKRS